MKNERYINSIHKMITGLFIPVIFYLLSQINALQAQVQAFQVQTVHEAAQYLTREDLVRIEQKIDAIRMLFIQEIKKGGKS